MHPHGTNRKQGTSILGVVFQTIVAGIIVGLFFLAVGSMMAASAGDPRHNPDEERSWVRTVIEMFIMGAEASERGSNSGSTG